MSHRWTSRTGAAVAAGLLAAAAAWAAPAQADPIDDSFLSSLGSAGFNTGDPAGLAGLGQSVCPMLAQPASSVGSVASGLIGNGGISPGMAGLFTELAVQAYCPQMISQLANGQMPSLPDIPGLSGGLPGGLPSL